jgi:sn-glycerol 3-phosphate transport system permease protein
MPTTLFVLINAVINAFRLIDHVIVMTRGGPDNASTLLLYYVYNVAFRFWDTAYSSALTVVLLLALALIAFVQFGILDRKVHYK